MAAADKKALEAYRVRQFGQSLFKDMRDPTGSTQDTEIQPDTARVVAHFDVDAFYCQVEELRRPGLSHRPLGTFSYSCSLQTAGRSEFKACGTAKNQAGKL